MAVTDQFPLKIALLRESKTEGSDLETCKYKLPFEGI